MRLPHLVARSALLAAATLSLAGCASVGTGSESPSTSSPGDASGTWSSDDGAARLTLEGGELTGTDGCNGVNGSYTAEGDDVAFSPGIMTRKACLGVTLSFSTLASGVIDDDRMTVYDTDGAELVVLSRD